MTKVWANLEVYRTCIFQRRLFSLRLSFLSHEANCCCISWSLWGVLFLCPAPIRWYCLESNISTGLIQSCFCSSTLQWIKWEEGGETLPHGRRDDIQRQSVSRLRYLLLTYSVPSFVKHKRSMSSRLQRCILSTWKEFRSVFLQVWSSDQQQHPLLETADSQWPPCDHQKN